jgi:glycosyltransferase involved in cell wall biosynthesis
MFLLVDGGPLQTPARDRGIGRYTAALLGALRAVRPGWRIQVVEHGRLEPIPPRLVHGLTVRRFDAPLPYDLAAPENHAVNDRYYADWLLARRPDHILFASVFEKLGVVPRFVGPRPRTSAVMYDLIPVLFPEHYGILDPREKWYAQRLRDAAAVDVLFPISGAAAADTRRLLGAGGPEVVNIRGAVDPKFAPRPAGEVAAAAARVRAKFGIDKPFVLYVGGPDYRKNLSGAVAGFAALPPALRDEYQLVIACFLPDEMRDATLRSAEQLGLGGRMVTTGFVTDEELIVLYQACRVFYFPSLYEGLGLPVLEALRCGAPVVCSNCSSLPEFAGPAAHLCDPADPASLAAALARALAEPPDAGRDERIAFAQSFTWEKTAEVVARGIETCRPPARPARRRVAWVGEAPPGASPLDPASLRLLTAVAGHCDLELVLPTHRVPAEVAARFRVLTPEEVEDRHEAAPFDVFALNVGAGGPDPLTLSVGLRHRGVVVLNHPDPGRFAGRDAWRLVSRAALVVVRSAAARRWARSVADAPVVLVPEPGAGVTERDCAARLAAAIQQAADYLDRADWRWLDSAANALAALPGPPPPAIVEDWAYLHDEARRTDFAPPPASARAA